MSVPDLIKQEKEIYKKLDELNKYYACYVRQKYNTTNPTPLPPPETDLLTCNGTYDKNILTNKYNEIIGLLQNFTPVGSTGKEYTTQYLINQKAGIDQKRAELQTKLDEINGTSGSHAAQSELELDGTVYASLIWTTMATCLIYYTMVIM